MDAKENTIYFAILIVSLVVLMVLIFFAFTMIRYQRRNLQLYREKLAMEITTLERERKRMAEDLHDELGPVLAGIKLKLNSFEDLTSEDNSTLEQVHRNITDLMNRMKTISNNLMPVVLMKRGLQPALEHLIEELNGSGPLKIKLAVAGLPSLDEKISINLYRICQEIITNTIKHSGASELDLRLQGENQNIILHTHDNGEGFDQVMAKEKKSGLGLRNLFSRTELLGGKLFVDSAVGRGTDYRIEIPMS